MGGKAKKVISIIIPVFNEEENIYPAYQAIQNVMIGLDDRYDYELLFTDNHSTDTTFEQLNKLAACDGKVRVLRFSRNFGYQRSIYSGYVHASGDAAIQYDCDLQDPPEMICHFVDLWEKGHHVVYGVRRTRNEPFWMNTIRKLFYRLIASLSEDHLPLDAGDFRLVDRRVIEEMRKIEDHQPYLRGTFAAMGFNQIGVPYDRRARLHGKSKFSWTDLFRLAVDGILNHSVVPLRLATYTGLIVSFVTFIGIIIYSTGKFFFHLDWPAGFATTTVLLLLSLSLNALFLGIIGEYLGRIYKQIKKRPVTIIERALNFASVDERK